MKAKDLKINRVFLINDSIVLHWEANIGLGEVIINQKGNSFEIDSEAMCSDTDKEFLEELFAKFKKYIIDNSKIIS